MDRVLAFMARYGHQDIIRLESDVPAVQVFAWAREIGWFVERENESNRTPR